MVAAIGWRLHRHHRGPQFLIDTTNTGWILLSGHQWIPRLGHQWVLFHGHGQVVITKTTAGGESGLQADVLNYRDGKLVKALSISDTSLQERVYGTK